MAVTRMRAGTITEGDAGGTAERLRYVFVARVRCPRCGSAKLKTLRSRREDGAVTRRTVCLTCGHRFFVVLS